MMDLLEASTIVMEGKRLPGKITAPHWNSDGTEIKSVAEAAASMGVDGAVAARALLASGHTTEEAKEEALAFLEEKVRHVRDVDYWKRPYGTPIIGSGKNRVTLDNLRVSEKPDYEGTTLVTSSDGKQKFHITQDPDTDEWVALGDEGLWDDVAASAKTEDGLYKTLDKKLGTSGPKKPTKPATAPKQQADKPAARSASDDKKLIARGEAVLDDGENTDGTWEDFIANLSDEDVQAVDAAATAGGYKNIGKIAKRELTKRVNNREREQEIKPPAKQKPSSDAPKLNAEAVEIVKKLKSDVTLADLKNAKEGDKVTLTFPGTNGINNTIVTRRNGRWHMGTADKKGFSDEEVFESYENAKSRFPAVLRKGERSNVNTVLPGGKKPGGSEDAPEVDEYTAEANREIELARNKNMTHLKRVDHYNNAIAALNNRRANTYGLTSGENLKIKDQVNQLRRERDDLKREALNRPEVTSENTISKGTVVSLADRIMAKGRSAGLPVLDQVHEDADGVLWATDRFRMMRIEPGHKDYDKLRDKKKDMSNVDQQFPNVDRIWEGAQKSTVQVDMATLEHRTEPGKGKDKGLERYYIPGTPIGIDATYLKQWPAGSQFFYNEKEPKKPLIVKDKNGDTIGLQMPVVRLDDPEYVEQQKRREEAIAKLDREEEERRAKREAEEADRVARMAADQEKKFKDSKLDVSGLTPAQKGRIRAHLDRQIRWEGRVVTNADIYAEDQWVSKKKATVGGRRGAVTEEYLISNADGVSISVPKMIFDSIQLPDANKQREERASAFNARAVRATTRAQLDSVLKDSQDADLSYDQRKEVERLVEVRRSALSAEAPKFSKHNVGDRVETEWGNGKVTARTERSVTIDIDGQGPINIVTGTPGFDRIKPEVAKTYDVQRAWSLLTTDNTAGYGRTREVMARREREAQEWLENAKMTDMRKLLSQLQAAQRRNNTAAGKRRTTPQDRALVTRAIERVQQAITERS